MKCDLQKDLDKIALNDRQKVVALNKNDEAKEIRPNMSVEKGARQGAGNNHWNKKNNNYLTDGVKK